MKSGELTPFINGNPVISMSATRRQEADRWHERERVIADPIHPRMILNIVVLGGVSAVMHDSVGHCLIGLGNGYVCESCGNYSPSGKYLCMRCGDRLVEKELVKPYTFPFRLVQYDMVSRRSDPVETRYIFDSFAAIDSMLLASLSLGSINVQPSSQQVTIDSGHYLCEWCGLVVADQDCYGCAGIRTPFRELVDMSHECLYCGSETVNGIVCDGCGIRMSGTAVADLSDP